MDERGQDAFSVEQFCRRHNISRAYLYRLWRQGEGPRWMQVGKRRLISREAAAEWRQQVEVPGKGLGKTPDQFAAATVDRMIAALDTATGTVETQLAELRRMRHAT